MIFLSLIRKMWSTCFTDLILIGKILFFPFFVMFSILFMPFYVIELVFIDSFLIIYVLLCKDRDMASLFRFLWD